MFSLPGKLPRASCTMQQDMPEISISDIAKATGEKLGSRSEVLCDGQVWFHVPTGTPVRDGREPDNLADSAIRNEQAKQIMDMRNPEWREKSKDLSDTAFFESFWLSPSGLVQPSMSYHLAVIYKGVFSHIRTAAKSHWMMIAGWKGDARIQLRFQFRRRQALKSRETVLRMVEAWNERANATNWPDGRVALTPHGHEQLEDGFLYRLTQDSEMPGGNIFPWLDLYYSIRLRLPERSWPVRVYWGKDGPSVPGPAPYVIAQ